jgi:hypothetical protein
MPTKGPDDPNDPPWIDLEIPSETSMDISDFGFGD